MSVIRLALVLCMPLSSAACRVHTVRHTEEATVDQASAERAARDASVRAELVRQGFDPEVMEIAQDADKESWDHFINVNKGSDLVRFNSALREIVERGDFVIYSARIPNRGPGIASGGGAMIVVDRVSPYNAFAIRMR